MSPQFGRLKGLIDLIPFEIFIEVFEHMVNPSNRVHPHSLEAESKALGSVMLVCTSWRRIVTESPFLLARIIDMDRDSPRRVLYLLENSAHHPLSIIGGWTSCPWISYRQESTLGFHERKENIRLMFQHFHRCDYLYVRLTENQIWDTQELGKILSKPSPTIRHFTFLWPSRTPLLPITSIFHPSCKTIQVSGDFVCNSTRTPSNLPLLSNLTTFIIHANCAQGRSSPQFSPSSAFTPRSWLSRLAQLPNLINLTIYDMLAQASKSDEPTRPVHLKRLQTLKVHGRAPECFDLIAGMEVAPLKRCIIECNILGMGATSAGTQRFRDGIKHTLAKLPQGATDPQFTLGCYEPELRLCYGEVGVLVCRQDPQESRMFPGHEYLLLWMQALQVITSDATWSLLLGRVTTLKLRSGFMILSPRQVANLASLCSSFLQLFSDLTTLVLGNFPPLIQNLLSTPGVFSSAAKVHIYVPGVSVDQDDYQLLASYLRTKSKIDVEFYCDGAKQINPRLLRILHASGALEDKEYTFVMMGSRDLQDWKWVNILPQKSVPEPDHFIC